jgi:hypothetical protein
MLCCAASSLTYPAILVLWNVRVQSKQFNIPCHFEGKWSLHPQAYITLPVTQHNLSEDQNPQHKYCGNMKSCNTRVPDCLHYFHFLHIKDHYHRVANLTQKHKLWNPRYKKITRSIYTTKFLALIFKFNE